MDPARVANFQRTLSEFESATGKTAEEGMKVIGRATCKRLATTVQPYGLEGGVKMNKFIKSIAMQVNRAWIGTNRGAFPAASTMEQAHHGSRRNGRVPRFNENGEWLGLVFKSDRDEYTKIAQAKAFRAKAAWVKIHNGLGKSKLRGVSPLITRHLGNARGRFLLSGKNIDQKIEFSNNVSYIRSIQYTEEVQAATEEGIKLGLKYMQTTTKKAIEKANKELQ